MKRYAIFFPQFHRIQTNDLAWGYGFTDWALVAAANAFGYWERRSPAYGFYDLADPDSVRNQFAAAAYARLDGFALYHYYFSDGPELSAVERYLAKSRPPDGFKYFFVWANENWSRRWAGRDTQILKTVLSSPDRGHARTHVQYVTPFMKSESYANLGARPMFALYRPDVFKDLETTVALYRDEFARLGIEVSIGFFLKNASDAEYSKFLDFCYVFEPRAFLNSFGLRNSRFAAQLFKKSLRLFTNEGAEKVSESAVRFLNGGARAYSFASFLEYFASDHRGVLLRSMKCPVQNVLTCGWNNAPRYRHRFTQLEVPTAGQFSEMLRLSLCDKNCSETLPLLCNAWNEWSEGAALEPCAYLGDELLKVFAANSNGYRRGF